MKKKVFGKKGFTLIEVILSMAILALVSVPLLKYFSDSIRHSVKASIQQKATMMAQETIEELKRQPTLIQKVLPSGKYTIPSMKDDYSISLSTGFEDTGRGEATLTRTRSTDDLTYDVEVTVDTNHPANDIERAKVHSVNDSTNVMIAEGSEEFEALNYFFTKNLNYVELHSPSSSMIPLGSPTATPAGPAPAAVAKFDDLTDVRANLHRDITIEIGKQNVSPFLYTIKVKYLYSCTNVTDNAIDYAPEYTVYDAAASGVEVVYLMFNIVDPDNDVIHIEWTGETLPENANIPEFILVCQNVGSLNGGASPILAATPSSLVGYTYVPFSFSQTKYELKIELTGGKWGSNIPVFRSNLIDPDDPTQSKGSIERTGGGDAFPSDKVLPMNAKEKEVTILNINVKVSYNGELKAEMNTTKTE